MIYTVFRRRMKAVVIILHIWAFFLRKRILQTRMPSSGTRCLIFGWSAKALVRLRGCAGSPEPSLITYVISTIFSWAGSFIDFKKCFPCRVRTKLFDSQSIIQEWMLFLWMLSMHKLLQITHKLSKLLSLCVIHQSLHVNKIHKSNIHSL